MAYKENPNHVMLLINIAACHEILGDRKESIRFFEEAIDIQPGFLIAQRQLDYLKGLP